MPAKVKNQKKYGRNRKSGQNLKYLNENRHCKSHVRRIKRHVQRYGFRIGDPIGRASRDVCARSALLAYAEKLGLKPLQDARAFLGIK